MKPLILKLRKQVFLDTAFWVLCIQLPCQGHIWADELVKEVVAADVKNEEAEERYTINFQNISMIEYVKFVSKIAGINFIFNEQDLQFAVTIVSEEPITVKNVMSTLVQVLRIHDLNLLEQENNLVISRSANVNQISTILSGDLPETSSKAPIVTRVFRLKNASPSSVAAIIRPMTSAAAIIEVSSETRQLIVTDVTTNVEKIAALLTSLDAPHTSLDIDSYLVKNISPGELVELVTQIVSPFAEGNPLIFVPQVDTNTIFIVSTPYLIERSLAVMTDLDVPPRMKIGAKGTESAELFIYKIQHQPANELLKAISQVVNDLKESPLKPVKLILALETVKLIPESNSLMFTADADTLEKIKNILDNLDSLQSVKQAGETFYIYKTRREYREKVERFLAQIVNNLNASQSGNSDLINTLKKSKWVAETESILFQGAPSSITTVKELMKTFETQENLTNLGKQTFFVYELKNTGGDFIINSLNNVAKKLEESHVPDIAFVQTLKSVKWLKENNSIIITGSQGDVDQVKQLIAQFDIASYGSQGGNEAAIGRVFFIYDLKSISGAKIEKELKKIAARMKKQQAPNLGLIHSLENIMWIEETNSLLIAGAPDVIDQIKTFIGQLDIGSVGKTSFFIYRPEYVSVKEVQSFLQGIHQNLKKSGLVDPELIEALEKIQYVPSTDSLLFTGTPGALDKVKELLTKVDVASGSSGRGKVENITFYIYHIQYASANQLIDALKGFAVNLEDSNLSDKAIAQSIANVKWIKENNSLLFTGSSETLQRIEELVKKFDQEGVSRLAGKTAPSFFIYKPEYVSVKEVQSFLQGIDQNLKKSGLVDPELIEALEKMQYVPSTDSLLFTGTPGALDKIKELLTKVDVSSGSSGQGKVENITFYIYHIQHASANQLIDALKSFAGDLEHSNLSDKAIAQSIANVKWIKENNSLLFTGSSETLQRIEELLKKFDQEGMFPEAKKTTSQREQVEGGKTTPSQEQLGAGRTATSLEQHTATQIAQTMREVVSQFAIYKPQYVTGEQLIIILQDFKKNLVETNVLDKQLFDAIDNLRWIPKTSSLLISGDPEAIAKIEELLKKFDVPSVASPESPESKEFIHATNFLVYKLQYQKGDEIQNAIKKIGASLLALPAGSKEPLTDAITSLQWIEVTNSLLASGDGESLQKIKHLIENLDIPLKQVLIEVLVIETTLSNGQTFGLEWIGKGQFKNRLAASTSSVATPDGNGFVSGFNKVNPLVGPSPADIPILSGFDLGVIGNLLFHKGQSFATLASLVSALQSDVDSTIVMNPKIVTQDNKSASIFIGRNIPFVGSVVTSTIAEQTTTTSLEYRNIGVSLTITPVLGDSDLVTLEIMNEISSAPENVPTTETGQVNGIITTQTTMNTRVHVPDQHFLILSGMISDTKDHSKVGIPCLGGLPVIGAAFSKNMRNYSKDNLIIFVRPHIINSYDDYRKVTEHQENLYKDMLPAKSLKESFDMGIDLLKSYKDE